MKKDFYAVTLSVAVYDELDLFTAALIYAVSNGQTEADARKLLLMDDKSINVFACLHMLLDPGVSPPGVEILSGDVVYEQTDGDPLPYEVGAMMLYTDIVPSSSAYPPNTRALITQVNPSDDEGHVYEIQVELDRVVLAYHVELKPDPASIIVEPIEPDLATKIELAQRIFREATGVTGIEVSEGMNRALNATDHDTLAKIEAEFFPEVISE